MWTCPKCGTKVDPAFEVCWRCGTSADGVEDPDFVRADDAPPIEDAPEVDDETLEAALGEEFGTPMPQLVECYVAHDTIEAQFLADRLLEQGIPAVADHRDMNTMLGGWKPDMWGYGPRVRVRAEDAERARAWLVAYDQRQKARRDRGE
ncbi:MAG TPA: DUF2007 domain-containing protein [Isosphaeraceae bacterium]|jgi:hypothetical protein